MPVGVPVSAVVGVDLTVDAAKARWAGAGVAVYKIGAVGAILARIAFTLVDVLLTSSTTKARQTRARESVDAIAAQTAITARI